MKNQRELLIEKYMYIAEIAAKQLSKYIINETFEELKSDCYLGLIEAIDSYTPSKGASLKNYLSFKTKLKALDHIRHRNHYKSDMKKHTIVVSDEIVEKLSEYPSESKAEDAIENVYLREIARAIKGIWDERENKIIWLYFFVGLNHKEIGKELSISESRVSQLKKRALRKAKEKLIKEGF